MSTLAAGKNFSVVVDVDGNVWLFGRVQNQSTRVPEKLDKDMAGVAAGNNHLLLLDMDGCLWAYGSNEFGQLGYAGSSEAKIPRELSLPKMRTVFAVGDHSFFIETGTGKVWGCGSNSFSQLGLGYTHIIATPVPIPELPPIKYVGGGNTHSLFVDTEGKVWGCGRLGTTGETTNFVVPLDLPVEIVMACGGNGHSIFLDVHGSVWACGNNSSGQICDDNLTTQPCQIQKLPQIQAISAALNFSVFLDVDGAVWGCGEILNLEHKLKKLVDPKFYQPTMATVQAGHDHILMGDVDNNVYGLGGNEESQSSGNGRSNICYHPSKINVPKVNCSIRKFSCKSARN